MKTQSLRLRCIICFAALAIGGCILTETASAEPRPRETWNAYVAGDLRYGSRHLTVTKESDERFRYRVTSRVLVDLMGVQQQELTTDEEFVVTAEYKPVSVNLTRSGPTGDVVVKGDVRDGELQVTTSRGELVSTRSVEITKNSILDVCFEDFLLDHSTSNGSNGVSFTLIDSSDWNAHPGRGALQSSEGSEIVWSVDLGSGLGQGTIKLDKTHVHQESKFLLPPRRLVQCSEREASQLQYRKLVGRDVLMFPLSKDIGLPERLKRLNIRLSWKDVPMSDLHLADLRQTVTKETEQDGVISATLEINLAKPIKDPVELPIRGSEFSQYLAETQFIKPRDEAIKQKAREWAGEPTNSLEAVRALSSAVSKYLQGGSLIAETLSGPEVLHCKQGKCSEFSTLFASLARSIGIPTRIVLGERLAGGQWVGHMWNEAYVGDWITVDTTVDEVGTSFSLIKLTHSDTVMGTQRARFGLTESLEIEVVDFEKAATTVVTAKTGVSGQTYTHADFACRITAANKDWKLVDKTQPGAALIQFQVPDEGVLIHFVAFAVPANIGPEIIGKGRQSLSASQLNDFKMLKNEAFEIGNARGQLAVFQGISKAAKKREKKTTEYIWTDGGAGFLLNLIASPANHEKYAADVETLLKSFERLESDSIEKK